MPQMRYLLAGLCFAMLPAAGAALAQDQMQVPQSPAEISLGFVPVVKSAAPAVVNIYARRVVETRSNPFMDDPFFGRMFRDFGQSRPRVQNSLGSGVILSADGIVVSNHHVVGGSTDIRVVLNDRREYSAHVLLADEDSDLAVLQLDGAEDLPALELRESGTVEVGELVLAIGNPFGVGQTVTSGIVSALARTEVGVTDFAFFIQTDAAINPGNSGGALIDMDGNLIGVNSAIYSRSGGSNGIGFAIPVEMVRRVVDAALTEGELVQPWLGARLQTVTGDIAASLGLDRPQGALVADIYPDAAADRAGLAAGDIILAIDGVEVNDEPGARFRYAINAVGAESRFRVLRDGDEISVAVPVSQAPGSTDPLRRLIDGRNPLAGVELVELSPAFNEAVGFDPFARGVVVMNVQRGSAADYFGFRPGDRVLELLGARVEEIGDVESLIDGQDDLKSWPIAIERRGRLLERTLQL